MKSNNRLNAREIEPMKPLKNSLIHEYLKGNCDGSGTPLKEFMNTIEKEVIARALLLSRGNQRIASFLLGTKPTTLNEKIKRLRIDSAVKPGSLQDIKQLLTDMEGQIFKSG